MSINYLYAIIQIYNDILICHTLWAYNYDLQEYFIIKDTGIKKKTTRSKRKVPIPYVVIWP